MEQERVTKPTTISDEDSWPRVPCCGAVVACAAMILGWNWDICWHRSIGRDTTWTPPHVAIYFALAVAFAYNAWIVLSYSFGRFRQLPAVRVLGFRGLSASFVTLWGILLQFMSIVFDDWWHDIYGLDVGVFSPPHALLAWGIGVFYFGQFFVVATYRNLTGKRYERSTRWALLLIGSFFLAHFSIAVDAAHGPEAVRSVSWTLSSATSYPMVLMLPLVYLNRRWASTKSAALYMLGVIVIMQVFQFFPASPTFGPVFHKVDTFLPPPFPLLLVVPALAMSMVFLWCRDRTSRPVMYLLLGVAFVVGFNVTNWLTSEFLMSNLADNRFFAGSNPGLYYELEYRPVHLLRPDTAGLIVVVIALFSAALTSWVGTATGNWMRRVVR